MSKTGSHHILAPLAIATGLLLAAHGHVNDQNAAVLIPLPAFEVDHKRSDPTRPSRPHNANYGASIIDIHAHLYPPNDPIASIETIDSGEMEAVLSLIKGAGVEHIVFMPTPNDGLRLHQELGVEKRLMIRDLDRHRVGLMCGSNYITVWMDEAYHNGYSEEDLRSGRWHGAGELALYHFDKGFHRQHVLEIPPNFEPFLQVVDLIADHGLWLDLHAEPVDPQGVSYEDEIFGGLELLFDRNPNLRVVYSHTAMTNPANARAILSLYPQVMMSIKLETRHEKWRNLEPVVSPAGELYEDWAQLFEEMPERFMIGTDFHFGREGVAPQGYEAKIALVTRILGMLAPDAALLIASESARIAFGLSN